MKFFIDAQLPSKMEEILQQIDFGSLHVDALPGGNETSDKDIAHYADRHGFIVMTKDFDFYHSHMILGWPQKLLIITTGNIKNRKLFDLIRSNGLLIKNLFASCHYVEFSNEGIIGHSF